MHLTSGNFWILVVAISIAIGILLGVAGTLWWKETRLLAAIRKHYDKNGNDLCWQGNDDELYEAAGLTPKQRQLPSEVEFQRNCELYRRDLYGPSE